MAGMFTKPIAPKTPVAADLGGPPGVGATPTKPMYSTKKPSKSRFGKPAGLAGGKR
jgi:hypothetical protein